MTPFLKYVKYSGVWVGLVLNPYHWQFEWRKEKDKVKSDTFFLGPLWLTIVIDNGNW